MFHQWAVFSGSETHLILFSLRQINKSFQLLEAINDVHDVYIVYRCSKTYLQVILNRLLKLLHPAKHSLDVHQSSDVAGTINYTIYSLRCKELVF